MQVTVELKNDLAISGTLHSVDQYLNVKLNNVHVINEHKYPHMVIPFNKLSKARDLLICTRSSLSEYPYHFSPEAKDT